LDDASIREIPDAIGLNHERIGLRRPGGDAGLD